MTSTDLVLPESVDAATWNADTAAMMEFAGLTWVVPQMVDGEQQRVRMFAPNGIVGAFIQAVRRTGLDPTQRQIYAAEMGGKWTVLVGIDGMRVVALRTGQYDGQDPVEWQWDDESWHDAPPKSGAVLAARVAVYRKGIGRPLVQTVTMREFGGKGPNWSTRPAHMLGIRAESHALRRLFPMELAGLYTPEDFEGAADPAPTAPSRDWISLVEQASTHDEIEDLLDAADDAGERTDRLRTAALARHGMLDDSGSASARDEVVVEPEPEHAEAPPTPAAVSPADLTDDEWLAQAEADAAEHERAADR
ncbi:recombinase RecT [Curtobacterium sp. DN_7.5]|uniref:recombinase RecT n=1 Tax=Curtobacterium sp. DN_7.5 TaxID=3049047 RepID=UPI001F58FA4B|nr:recombinase RecT [Curtobacterium sp. DN_7.5]